MKIPYPKINISSNLYAPLIRFTCIRFFIFTIFLFSFTFGSILGKITSNFSLNTLHAATSENWGLSFPEKGKLPQANATIKELQNYHAYYAEDTSEKKLYLTFDAGYENGNTAQILDTLKKQQVPAAFFVVGTYIESEPDLIKRMAEEGHIVANHTYHHPDMSQISSLENFTSELQTTEKLFTEVTGKKMPKFYRPPQGIYSEENLLMAKNLGYHTFFWSVAYVDWIQDQQPTKEEAFEKLLGRVHPGAIILLHSTSSTNAQILDELITRWQDMGYSFHSIQELINIS